MMDLNLRKEQFSRAYVHAIASAAGFGVSVPTVDEDSVDLQIGGRILDGLLPLRPRIDVQMKCTAEEIRRDDQLIYPLRAKNYNQLNATNVLVPRLLVVVLVPESEDEWLLHSEHELIMRRCGYWIALTGREDTVNSSTVSVAIPRTNVLDVAGLRGLMTRAGRKEPL